MYKLILIATLLSVANAGLISGGSFASSPALGAPLLGSVSYNAPEVSVVKQPVTIDQPEIRYRSVPTLIQSPPVAVVKTVQPALVAAPAVTYATQAVAGPAISYAAPPSLAYGTAGLGLGYGTGLGYSTAGLGYATASGLTYNTPGLGLAHASGFSYVV